MKPQIPDSQHQLFQPRLEVILNDRHPLYTLAAGIDWQAIDMFYHKAEVLHF